MTKRILLASLVTLALGIAGMAAAHEDAVLESPQSAVAAGAVLAVTGKDFTEGQSYALRLVGALNEYDLGNVSGGEGGRFSIDLQIPPAVKPGVYTLRAVAADGDEVASLDLTVTQAGRSSRDSVAQVPDEGLSRSGGMARSDEIVVERSRSGLEWGVIGLIIGLAGGLGIGLVRRSAGSNGISVQEGE
ncbi:MAG: hypothetical protein GWN32_05850 [Gemmatimonadetes bacterium]|nr:hypothetical protein [Gemmatimonadota bacterium]